jgi:citrate lyase subunit beta / citryl-CoA lyase
VIPADVDRIRTWLYVPADRPERIDKALASGADAVIIDLEDAVAPTAKAGARAALSDWLKARSARSQEATGSIWVRINSITAAEDLEVACHPLVDGICLPKAESPAAVAAVIGLLSDLDQLRRPGGEPTAVMLLIETARGVLAAAALAAGSERILALQIGELDLRADLRLPPPTLATGAERPPLPGPIQAARDAVVLAAAAAGLTPPVAPVSPDVHDPGLEAETGRLRAAGFGSRAVIHPAQLGPVAAAFAPTTTEIAWATRVVEASEAAEKRGEGVVLLDGRMVDAPVVAQAATILARRARR